MNDLGMYGISRKDVVRVGWDILVYKKIDFFKLK